ncbi:hypothetical protein [Blastococcus sp. SYSU DS0973]
MPAADVPQDPVLTEQRGGRPTGDGGDQEPGDPGYGSGGVQRTDQLVAHAGVAHPQTAELLAVARRLLTANLRQGQALLEVLDGAQDAVALADTARPVASASTS